MSQPEKTFAESYVERTGDDPDIAKLDRAIPFDGWIYFPAQGFDGFVNYDENGDAVIIVATRMSLPTPGIAIPLSPVQAREMATALVNMAKEVEDHATQAAEAALKKAAGK